MIRNILSLLTLLCAASATVQAQEQVRWTFTAKKINKDLFEIHLTAKIQPGWHVYAEHQVDTDACIPVTIQFTEKQGIVFKGRIDEQGNKITAKDPTFGIDLYEFESTVDYKQLVKLETIDATSIEGTLTYQVCSLKECLPPAKVGFSIKLPADQVAVK